MRIGRFTIEPLNEGQFEFFPDGKINRSPVPETPEKQSVITGKRSLAGINPLYVTDGTCHILLDVGLGWGLDAGSANKDVSNICTNLDIFGVSATEITHIILSHLHYDHSAGISYTDEEAGTRAVFPNAACYLQQSEWDYAIGQAQLDTPASLYYRLDDLYRLYADSFFELIDESEKEIIPGISLLKTGGHTPGHQVVKISDIDGEWEDGKDGSGIGSDGDGDGKGESEVADEGTSNSAYYVGDLVPSPAHLNHVEVAARHTNRMQAKKMKIRFLRKAYSENALLYFYHSLSAKGGRLKMDEEKNYVFEEI
jgi:glyoxylase-like metal-dependent hydrolase (beta-lactamase superfamily II)